jgi:DNA modification methylase
MAARNDRIKVWYHTAESMPELSSQAATLALTSPPYTNRPDGKSLDKAEYLWFVERVIAEVARVLVDGGVLAMINTDLRDHNRYNGGHAGFDGIVWYKHVDLRRLAEDLGLRCFDTRIWVKSLKTNHYRYNFSYIQFFQKGPKRIAESTDPQVSSLFNPHVWLLEGGTMRTMPDGKRFRDAIHPEVVERCIARFTRPGDLVLNPFSGSGTVLAVSAIMGRRAVGYEVDNHLAPLIDQSVHGPGRSAVYAVLEDRYRDPLSMMW